MEIDNNRLYLIDKSILKEKDIRGLIRKHYTYIASSISGVICVYKYKPRFIKGEWQPDHIDEIEVCINILNERPYYKASLNKLEDLL